MNLKKILSRSLLALALSASGAAFAGPAYHVSLDTSTLGSGTAFLDLGLANFADSASVTATLSHFTGAFGEYSAYGAGSSGSVGGTVMLHTNDTGWSDLFQGILLGGSFGFDVSFDTSATGNSASFVAQLYNGDKTGFLGVEGNLLEIDLMPGQADMVSPANAFASVTPAATSAVPEPSTLLSMVTGVGLLGFGLRRRAR
ncbi:NF038129 family PEP-CTERM protein [Massilia sp. 9096]|uniref:NF038129 family PEP-CTERM protein n=1 Tax=Massilia sp. 9096 TaxID=1500894 RepID=UPI0005656552|nr:NF038129 family PEP-CTERM protein [Massilia sp. 9096]